MTSPRSTPESLPQVPLSAADPAERLELFGRLCGRARRKRVPFLIGAGYAAAAYTGQPRVARDLDLYVLRSDRERMIDILDREGLEDLFPRKPYDRGWIYRGVLGDSIVDVIWTFANYRTEVRPDWFTRGPEVLFAGERVKLIPAEELIWTKLYVLQRDRTDWPDVLNLVHAVGPSLDWSHMADELQGDIALLRAIMAVFLWISPGRAQQIPACAWDILDLSQPPAGEQPDTDWRHVQLIDSRPWYLVGTLEEPEPGDGAEASETADAGVTWWR